MKKIIILTLGTIIFRWYFKIIYANTDIEIVSTNYLFATIVQDKNSLLSKLIKTYDYTTESFIEVLETSHDLSFKE